MRIVTEKNIMVPMRDGVELATDVYHPDAREPLPTLVQRLPYNKELWALTNLALDVARAVQAGYVVLVQDTRGRFASGGNFNPFFDEPEDGADTIAWAASQPWPSGNVATAAGPHFRPTHCLAPTPPPSPQPP